MIATYLTTCLETGCSSFKDATAGLPSSAAQIPRNTLLGKPAVAPIPNIFCRRWWHLTLKRRCPHDGFS